MDYAAQKLCLGGYLSFWFPVSRKDYSDDCLPSSGSLELIHNVEQILTVKCSRYAI